jgi:hypothetical protein
MVICVLDDFNMFLSVLKHGSKNCVPLKSFIKKTN